LLCADCRADKGDQEIRRAHRLPHRPSGSPNHSEEVKPLCHQTALETFYADNLFSTTYR
ncbi:uncharacterized protein METZ01_LOCUS267117, partial [marine metagenome]